MLDNIKNKNGISIYLFLVISIFLLIIHKKRGNQNDKNN